MAFMRFRLLPWEYGVRNLFRRPSRSLFTLLGLTTVVLLILLVVGFIRGLERSLAVSGDKAVVLVYSLSVEQSLENSAIPANTAALLAASLPGVQSRYGQKHVSPELYLGTRIAVGDDSRRNMGLVRGVTAAAPLVRRQVQILEGAWPADDEVLVGRLAHSKLGCRQEAIAIGQTVQFEGRTWRVSGTFAAGAAAFESELWCSLPTLQQALKRQDLSLVAVTLAPSAAFSDVQLFCKERFDLKLQASPETAYYASLQKHYQPVRMLGWILVFLVAGSGIFAGLNTMYGSVVGRVRELSTLQAMGFRRLALLMTLVQESTLLAAVASLLAALLALALAQGTAVRFTMGAFTLRIDGIGIFVGCGTGLLLGALGALPPAMKAMRVSVVKGIKAI